MRYVVEDDYHCERIGEYNTYAEAVEDLYYLASLDWDVPPNRCPCVCCERMYSLTEQDESVAPPLLIRRERVLKISPAGPEWVPGFDKRWQAAEPKRA